LTPSEIRWTIERAFRLYGETSVIVLDTTDANGMGIYRELRKVGLPVLPFTFNARDSRGVSRKSAAIRITQRLLTEGMVEARDPRGELDLDEDGVPVLVSPGSGRYGAIRWPAEHKKLRNQLSVLRADDSGQRNDAAMAFNMLCYVAEHRRSAGGRVQSSPFDVFAGGRRYG